MKTILSIGICSATALTLVLMIASLPPSASSVIEIGYVTPLTGDAATYGVPMKDAAQMAVDEINATGGVQGKKLKLILEDSRCKGNEALGAVQKLISIDHVKILDGFVCAEDVLAAAPVIEQNKALAISPGASSPKVTIAGDYIFQNNPSATILTTDLASLVFTRYKSVAVITEETAFATDVSDHFSKQFEQLGGKVIAAETYPSETKDFRSLLAKLKEAHPPAIFVNPQTEAAGGLIIKQARELGIQAQLYGIDPLSGPTTREISGPASEGMLLVTVPELDSSNPKSQAFLSAYQAKYGEPSFALYLASAYDSVYLIAQAIRAVGEDPTKMKDYLYALPSFAGAAGTYHFDSNGDMLGISPAVYQIKNGKVVPISAPI